MLSTVPSGGIQGHGAPDRLWTDHRTVTGLGQQGVCWRWWGAGRADTPAGAGVHSAAGGLGSGARSLGPCDAAAWPALPDSSPGRSDPARGAEATGCRFPP